MSKKFNNIDIWDIPEIIDIIVSDYGQDGIGEILDVLLRERNHELLMDMIRNKANSDTKNQSQNNYFIIGLEVYRYIYDNECDVKIAERNVSEQSYLDKKRKGITVNTVKRHKEEFVKAIKKDIVGLYSNNHKEIKDVPIKEVKQFINDFFKFYDDNYTYWYHENKKSNYKIAYTDFVNTKNINLDEIPF